MIDPAAEPVALDDNDRKELLRIARVTLKEWLKSGRTPPGVPHRASLLARAPAFVTLHVRGELRGCIGQTMPETPLYRTVGELAISSASRDPRFAPLRADELADARLSISVLGNFERAHGPSDVVVGTHGLRVTLGARRGLLLPQVAVEHAMDAATFLAQTCVKAGVDPEAWRDPECVIERFTADVFEEPEAG